MEDTAVEFMRTHLHETALRAARQIKAVGIQPYAKLEVEPLAQLITPSIVMDLNYLESGDLTQWRDFHTKLLGPLFKRGPGLDNIVKVGQIISQELASFAQTRLPQSGTIANQPAEKVAKDVQRRITNLTAAALSITTGAALKQDLN